MVTRATVSDVSRATVNYMTLVNQLVNPPHYQSDIAIWLLYSFSSARRVLVNRAHSLQKLNALFTNMLGTVTAI